MPSNSLEQEAMERVARMYASFDRREQGQEPKNRKPKPEIPQEAEKPAEKPQGTPDPPALPKPAGFLDLMMRDKDQSLILLLLVLLMKDGADLNLMLALLYLLL